MCIRDSIKSYKTSVYHPSSNPSERILREVGRILRTYCHQQQRKWPDYLSATEDFLNLAYHTSINCTLYTAMYEKQPPREIQELIKFPKSQQYQFNKVKFYNQVIENLEKHRNKYQKIKGKKLNMK